MLKDNLKNLFGLTRSTLSSMRCFAAYSERLREVGGKNKSFYLNLVGKSKYCSKSGMKKINAAKFVIHEAYYDK